MNLTLKLVIKIFCLILVRVKLTNGEISTANNQFGLKLYSVLFFINLLINSLEFKKLLKCKALAFKTEGDFGLSPFPLSTLFGLIYSGGTGTTRKEIQNIFQFADDPSDVIRDYSRVIRDFEASTIILN
jgi:serine protease inhibitor